MTKLADSKYVWWFFAVAVVFVYFFGLNFPLVGPDEPRYAQVAREMFDRGDWITPTLGGFEWFEKPALLYWLQIIGYKLFGVNEFAARFGSALFGLGTVASLWILGRAGNIKATESEAVEFANWLALVAASTLGILIFSRGASFDIIVTFPLTASLVGFLIADRARPNQHRKRWAGLTAFYFFAGLAVLAKGLIGIVFPFGIVVLYFLMSRRMPAKQVISSLLWGWPLVIAVAAVWNVPMYLNHGWKFVDEFYIQHHFQRFTSNKYQHPQPFYFYFWVLPLMTLPWLPLFLAGTIAAVRESVRREKSPGTASSALIIFAFAWIAVPLLFFSGSGSKLPGYILPAVPGSVVISAIFIERFIIAAKFRKILCFGIAAGTFVLVISALVFTGSKFADAGSVRRLVRTADAAGYSQNRVACFRTLSHNAEFYAAGRLIRGNDGKQLRFDDPADLETLIASNGTLLVLVPLKQLDALKTETRFAVNVIADNSDLAITALSLR